MSARSTELHYLAASEVAAAMARREISPVEVTRHMLERIERLDPMLRSYLTVTGEIALDEARAAERDIMQGKSRGPLHGVPIAIKDLCDTAGVRTTAGTRVMVDRIPARAATVVARLRAAGAVMLGKLNMTEAAHAENHPDYAPAVNPWNEKVWTGVSSSGSGVATAAGLCFGAIGTDTGGSIRFPSAMNGLVGIKPTYGRVSRHGVFPMSASLDHVGPMCRTVLDAAVMLGIIAGRDLEDPTSALVATADYAAAARNVPRSLAGLRVGIDRNCVGDDLDAELCELAFSATDVLEQLGAEIREIELPRLVAVTPAWTFVCSAEMLVAHAQFYPERAGDYGPALSMMLEIARHTPVADVARAYVAKAEFTGRLERMFESVDVLACPTVAVHMPASLSMLEPDALLRMTAAMQFTAPFNWSGSPTISLPCGFRDGVPASLQLVGRHFDEATIIRVAAAYEAATEWHLEHPPFDGGGVVH